jgi:hypothetical protein
LTTQGYLSDGNSHKISISGSGGNDFFDVLRNNDILDLNGETGDDTFVVRSFVALEINEDAALPQTQTWMIWGSSEMTATIKLK